MKKHYYLFRWRIWSVEIEAPEIEEVEDVETESGSLSAMVQTADGNPLAFGFTPWTPPPWGDDWED